jgi:hypothetical protein
MGMERVEQLLGRVMAAEEGKGLRAVVRAIAYEGRSKRGVTIDDCDSIAKKGKAIGGREAGEASTQNHDGLSGCGCHDIRERIHTPAAMASR